MTSDEDTQSTQGGDIRRELFERPGPPWANVARISHWYDATGSAIWHALSDARVSPRWFPITGDLRVGARYVRDDVHGSIIESDAARHFKASWDVGDFVSWISVTLTDEFSGGTWLGIEHEYHAGAPVGEGGWLNLLRCWCCGNSNCNCWRAISPKAWY